MQQYKRQNTQKRNTQKYKGQQQSVQIMAGKYRRRKIDFIAVDDLRPTGVRLRETLFNWLQPYIADARCLDLFAGSGILGFEAISRGAKQVTFVEKNRLAANQLTSNIKKLSIDNARVCNMDFRQITEAHREAQYDVIFLDPPYKLRLLPELLIFMQQFNPQFIFIEDNQPLEQLLENSPHCEDYELYRSKKAGGVYYGLLRKI